MEALKIIVFSVLAAVLYGVLHDRVTAHVCVEYFTVAHPPVFETNSPFWLAIGWGIIATWWVGLILGLILTLSARCGAASKIAFRSLRSKIVLLMFISAAMALAVGLLGALFQSSGLNVIGSWENEIPAIRHSRFAFAAWAHTASYLCGGIGGFILVIATLKKRFKQPLPR